jgi:hypothetical protein
MDLRSKFWLSDAVLESGRRERPLHPVLPAMHLPEIDTEHTANMWRDMWQRLQQQYKKHLVKRKKYAKILYFSVAG